MLSLRTYILPQKSASFSKQQIKDLIFTVGVIHFFEKSLEYKTRHFLMYSISISTTI